MWRETAATHVDASWLAGVDQQLTTPSFAVVYAVLTLDPASRTTSVGSQDAATFSFSAASLLPQYLFKLRF